MAAKASGNHATYGYALQVDAEAKRKILARLKRIEGQVRGLHRMVEDARYCPQIMEQISAVQQSLRGVGKLLLRNHLQHCVTSAVKSGDQSSSDQMYDELSALFFKHAR